jgi:putative ABC transport system ATP-binding protein
MSVVELRAPQPGPEPPAEAIVSIEKVTRRYGEGDTAVEALRGVTLEVAPAKLTAIMGPSGSGKSTLLNLLGCLDRPTSGTYRLDGQEVSELDDLALSHVRRHKIGFVFQAFHMVPRLTAKGNVELPMVFAGVPPEERGRRAEAALASVGLAERMDHRPDQLSGGERQRAAIARAMVMGPALLLADEPTGNLDSVSGGEVVALLEAMNAQGLTLVVVTHDAVLGRRARRQVRMADGAIVEERRAEAMAAARVQAGP